MDVYLILFTISLFSVIRMGFITYVLMWNGPRYKREMRFWVACILLSNMLVVLFKMGS